MYSASMKNLTVINIGRNYSISANKIMIDINADAVLKTVVIDVALCEPASI